MEAGFFLEFNAFKKIANVTLQIPLYCGTTEENIKEFKERWQISEEELSPERQRKIMQENQVFFLFYTFHK